MSSTKIDNTQKIGLFLLVLLMTGAIDNIRNLPSTATSGTYIFFFFGIAVIFFLLPVALVSAELTATHRKPGEEGIYGWVRKAFGPKMAMLAIWFQWINTLIWYPTILTFIAGTTAFLINPDLTQNFIYVASFVCITFWVMTFVNLRGLKVSATFASICTMIGMVIPMGLIIIFVVLWLILGKPVEIHFTAHTIIPDMKSHDSWMGLTAIIASFLGLELATVHVRNVKNAKRTFPIALLIASVFMVITMILGALAVAVLFPADKIDLVNGALLSFRIFLDTYHMGWAFNILVLMVIIGSIGSMVNWIISPARGLLQAADDHFLPDILDKRNAFDVPQNIMILQAIIVTLVCSLYIFVPSVNASYWLLTDLSTEIYIFMYMIMFFAAIKLKMSYRSQTNDEAHFSIPFGKVGTLFVCALGLMGTAFCAVIGFIPPDDVHYSNSSEFVLLFTGSLIVAIIPVGLFYWYRCVAIKKL